MKITRKTTALSIGIPGAGALALFALSAHSQPSPAPEAPSTASASAAPSSPLAGKDIPAETSDPPKPPEWDTARAIEVTQDRKKVCSVKALREWLRFECLHRLGAALVAGETSDIKIWGWGQPLTELPWRKAATQNDIPRVIFTMRLRRGESKIFELYKLDWTYEGYAWSEPAEKIAVAFREGKEDPIILIE